MDDRDLLICGGQVIDPANGINGKRDILLRHGRVDVVGENLPPGTNRVIDATGCLGGRIATTPRGISFLKEEGFECVTAAPDWI